MLSFRRYVGNFDKIGLTTILINKLIEYFIAECVLGDQDSAKVVERFE
jgi:hypothetical protein